MPELPEVETVKMGLTPAMQGHRFTNVVTRRGDLRVPFPPHFAERLTGRKIDKLWRRAKYLLAQLDNGETLVMHLGMSGRMSVYAEGKERKLGVYRYEQAPADAGHGKHDHVVMETDAPARIVFTDARRFGLMTIVETDKLDENKLFKGLGIEPLSEAFDAAWLDRVLRGKRTPIKSALLDQRVVAGLGNIYVCEALFRAGISPKRLASSDYREAGDRRLVTRRSRRCSSMRSRQAARACAITCKARTAHWANSSIAFAVYDRRRRSPARRKSCKGIDAAHRAGRPLHLLLSVKCQR
jgi:formamidopyrimidine-DNA glycosylase